MVSFPDPADRNALADDCRRCPALVEDRTRISWGVGSTDAAIAVVGEAPGAGDPDADRWRGGNHTGMAYTSRHSGRQIRSLFESLGYDPDELYVTNAVKCFPSDGTGSNREPTAAERRNCRPHLLAELSRVDPTCVVATGRHATASLLSVVDRHLDGFLEVVLKPIETDRLPPIVPILHPSYRAVWVGRLGYDPDEYVRAVGETLDALGAGPSGDQR
jgi:DNA polymerase